MNTNLEFVNVIDKNGTPLAPCKVKVAWVLLQRKRAIKINDSTIQITLTKQEIKANKKAAIERDKRICHYCGKYIPESEIATADHIIPKTIAHNGSIGYDDIDNLVCACRDCNNHKGHIPYNQYAFHRILALSIILAIFLHISIEQVLTTYFVDNLPIIK